ncbi:hypothetical protein F0265_06720 [Vibrio sp. RE88]|nr:hypothetical protein [Vibrio sp. RE88]
MVSVQQGELYINFYRRTKDEIKLAEKQIGSITDNLFPTWWPQYKYPIKFVSSPSRSMVPEYFVFWDGSPIDNSVVTLIGPEWYDKSKDISFLGNEWNTGFINYENQVYYDITGRAVKWGNKSEGLELSKLPLLIPYHHYDERKDSFKVLCK